MVLPFIFQVCHTTYLSMKLQGVNIMAICICSDKLMEFYVVHIPGFFQTSGTGFMEK